MFFFEWEKGDDNVLCWSREKFYMDIVVFFLFCLFGCRYVSENGRFFLVEEEVRRVDRGCVFN